jgi:hypothetical protein
LALSYGWNRVGQRTSMTIDGHQDFIWLPAAASSTGYTANALNQYSAIDDGTAVNPEYDLNGNFLDSDGAPFDWLRSRRVRLRRP